MTTVTASGPVTSGHLPSSSASSHENKRGGEKPNESFQMSNIDGNWYKMKDGKPIERIKVGSSVSKESIQSYSKLYLEKQSKQKMALDLDKDRQGLIAAEEAFLKEKSLLDAERQRVNENKNKLMAEIKLFDIAKKEQNTRLNDIKEGKVPPELSEELPSVDVVQKGIDAKNTELTQETQKYKDDFKKINDSIALYNSRYKEFLIRKQTFLKQVDDFAKDKEALNKQMEEIQKKMDDEKNNQTEVHHKILGKFNAIFLDYSKPYIMLMSIPCYKAHAGKSGYLETISWTEKCAIKGETEVVHKDVLCLASSTFDEFANKIKGSFVNKGELSQFYIKADDETKALKALYASKPASKPDNGCLVS
ncbi:MAG: hypothetical protein H0W88_11820 [Parachlamydiaceae bacterium]|nr:hypothetical protein [Parachlamydiaceae bacterium]